MKVKDCKGILEVGDWVRTNESGIYKLEGEIGEIQNDSFFVWQNECIGGRGKLKPETKGYKFSCMVFFDNEKAEIEILTKTTKPNNTMSLKEAFATLFTKEPYKTFRKAGITNGDNELTSEGRDIFLAWLLEQNAEGFKEIAAKILEEQKERK